MASTEISGTTIAGIVAVDELFCVVVAVEVPLGGVEVPVVDILLLIH
jgi:hypothetical protein